VLLREFGIADAGLGALAEIIHDIDVKEPKFGRPETTGIDHLVTGIAWGTPDDEGRLAQGAVIFDALYAYFRRRKG
jgi:hypothetical protein